MHLKPGGAAIFTTVFRGKVAPFGLKISRPNAMFAVAVSYSPISGVLLPA